MNYEDWQATCDTLHAHSQVLGKLAAKLAPPEPQLQHAALRLTARGYETSPLPALDGSGAFVVGLDLSRHEAFVEHSAAGARRIAIEGVTVAAVTDAVLRLIGRFGGRLAINPTPQEVGWDDALDVDTVHRHYRADQAATHFAMATQAALVLAEFRAPFRGRATPVNAWWGSFDLAVNLFSGRQAEPPSEDFIMRNAMDSQEVAVGWWPGDANHPHAAFYAYAHPAPEGFAAGSLQPSAAHWDSGLGEYVLDWDDVLAAPDPHAAALAFARSAFAHACVACDWAPDLAATLAGNPPPIR